MKEKSSQIKYLLNSKTYRINSLKQVIFTVCSKLIHSGIDINYKLAIKPGI